MRCSRSEARARRWARALTPAAIFLARKSQLVYGDEPASPGKTHPALDGSTFGAMRLLILTHSARVATSAASGSNATAALGLSYALVTALASLLVEKGRVGVHSGRSSDGSVAYVVNGYLEQECISASSDFDGELLPWQGRTSAGRPLDYGTRPVERATYHVPRRRTSLVSEQSRLRCAGQGKPPR